TRILDRGFPPADSFSSDGSEARRSLWDGFVRGWIRRADVHRFLVRPEVRGQPSLDGSGFLRGRPPPGWLLDRLGTTGVPDRAAEHDGLHAPPIERAVSVGPVHANARMGGGRSLRTVRALSDGRARPTGLRRRHGRSEGTHGRSRIHQHRQICDPPLGGAERGGPDGAGGGGSAVRGCWRPEDRLRRLALSDLPEGTLAERRSRGPARRGRHSSSSSACVITGARATTCAPSSTRMVRTPWLARPTRRMSPAPTRMTMPEEEMTNMSWPFDPTKAPASSPVFRVREWPMTPFPPRPFVGYSFSGVRLPYPCCVALLSPSPAEAGPTAMTSSPWPRRIPITPAVARPIGRTRASLNRIVWPFRDTRMISSLPLVRSTSIISSPGFRFTAVRPVRGGSSSGSGAFFTIPRLVAKNSYAPSSESLRSITVETFSSPVMLTPGRFAAYRPLAVRPASGT